MRFLLALVLLLPLFLLADEYSDTPDIEQKQLYITYEKIPEKIYLSQVFSITIKTLSTQEHFENIVYEFSNSSGVKLLSKIPNRKIVGRYYYDSFSFIASSHYIKLPEISAKIQYSTFHTSNKTTLASVDLLAIQLRDTKDFSHVIAKKLILHTYKTTKYSHSQNITLFSATATNSDLSTFKLNDILKQGFESLENDYNLSKMTYYAVIDADIENLKFTYFNSVSEKYETLLIPIIVEDDSVSTQSDLAPQENAHKMIKVAIAVTMLAILLILYVFRQRNIYLILILFSIIYIILNAMPIQQVCIQKGSYLHILPMQNSTLFDVTKERLSLEVLDTQENFTKVKIHEKIGWIENENICTD